MDSKPLRIIAKLVLMIVVLGGCSLRTVEDVREPSPAVRSTTDLGGKTVLLPPTAPDRSNFTPLGYFTISLDSELTGILVLYSSPDNEQAVTYLELYNQEGRLILIQWIEKSGSAMTAIDSGILDEDGSEPVGVLRLVVEGVPA